MVFFYVRWGLSPFPSRLRYRHLDSLLSLGHLLLGWGLDVTGAKLLGEFQIVDEESIVQIEVGQVSFCNCFHCRSRLLDVLVRDAARHLTGFRFKSSSCDV